MSDKDLIETGEWVPCRICESVFARKRETRRVCAACENAACEGEHGGRADGRFLCVICGVEPNYKTRQVVSVQAV